MSAPLTAEQLAEIREVLTGLPTAPYGDVRDAGVQLLAEVERLRAERDAFADRVDTLTAVAKGNKRHVQQLFGDLQAAQARVAELEALPPLYRAVWRGGKSSPTTSYEDAWRTATDARARGERDAGVTHYGSQRTEYVPGEGGER